MADAADQKLFIQRQEYEDLKEFTCFRYLPIELRLKIWRSCFSNPHMFNLAAWFRHYACFYNSSPCASIRSKCYPSPLLPTLYINRVSPHETLKTYSVFLGHKISGKKIYTADPSLLLSDRDSFSVGECCSRNAMKLRVVGN